MVEQSLAESSYYSASAALRRETLWKRAGDIWKRQRESTWFWAVEIGSALAAALLTKDDPVVIQAMTAAAAASGSGLLIWLSGIIAAPYLWRRDAKRLLPPFDDNYARTVQRLMAIRIAESSPEGPGTGTAFEALFQIHPHLATGVTVQDCAKLLSGVYRDGSAPSKKDINLVLISFIAELSMLHVVRRDGNRFYLTDFGKDFLDRHMLYLSDLDIADDGTLAEQVAG